MEVLQHMHTALYLAEMSVILADSFKIDRPSRVISLPPTWSWNQTLSEYQVLYTSHCSRIPSFIVVAKDVGSSVYLCKNNYKFCICIIWQTRPDSAKCLVLSRCNTAYSYRAAHTYTLHLFGNWAKEHTHIYMYIEGDALYSKFCDYSFVCVVNYL